MNNNKRDWLFEYKCIFYLAKKDFDKIDNFLDVRLTHDYSFYYITALKYYYKKMFFESLSYFKVLLANFKVKKNEVKWMYNNIIYHFYNDNEYVKIIGEINELMKYNNSRY